MTEPPTAPEGANASAAQSEDDSLPQLQEDREDDDSNCGRHNNPTERRQYRPSRSTTNRLHAFSLSKKSSFRSLVLSHKSRYTFDPMELVHFVKDEDAKLAREMEEKLLSLPIESGILFAGVSVGPPDLSKTHDRPVFHVWIGCSRAVDPRMIPTLVKVKLRDEISQGHVIRTEAYMGAIRK